MLKKLGNNRYKQFFAGLAIVAVVIGVFTFLSVFEIRSCFVNTSEGDVSLENVYAPFNFFYASDIDQARWDQLKKEALNSVDDVYTINKEVSKNSESLLKQFYDTMLESRTDSQNASGTFSERFSRIKEKLGVDISDSELRTLIILAKDSPEKIKLLYEEAVKVCYEIYNSGLWRLNAAVRSLDKGSKTITVVDPQNTQSRKTVEIESVYILEDVDSFILGKAANFTADKKYLKKCFVDLVLGVIKPNLRYSPNLTILAKEEASNAVPKQYKIKEIKKGEIVVEKGQRLSRQDIEKLSLIAKNSQKKNLWQCAWSHMLMISLILLLFMFYLRATNSKIYNDISSMIIFSSLIIFLALCARIIFFSPLSSYLVPYAAVIMLCSIIFGFKNAFTFSIFICVLTGLFIVGNIYSGIMGFLGGIVGAYMVKNVRHRSDILKASLFVGIVNFITVFSISGINDLNITTMVTESILGFFNAAISGGIVMLALPVYEYTFNLTTDVNLLELCDMQHPLLKDMLIKAEGTYHHSIIVSSLVEVASEAVGANVLIGKVASYFHDIGKMENAEYYAENQKYDAAYYEKLSPYLSALIIIEHVKKGVELAKKYKLKKDIIDTIAQHHGNSVVSFFYQKAVDEAENGAKVEEHKFRYPGPKPQTKEAAILLLADSVEAASRSLSNPTPSKIQELVKKIINSKFLDGQLDECPLTLKDINKISDVFIKTLVGVYHSRVKYPDENKDHKHSK